MEKNWNLLEGFMQLLSQFAEIPILTLLLQKIKRGALIEELGAPHFEGSKWVRRTPHFFALRAQLGAVQCDDEKSGREVRGAAHFRVRTPHRTRNVKRWGFQKRVRCGATQNC